MPKLEEDDFVDPGNLPSITQSKMPPPPGGAAPMPGVTSGGMGGSFGGGVAAPQIDRNAAGSNAAQGAEVLVKHSKESEDWINKKWRPVMG